MFKKRLKFIGSSSSQLILSLGEPPSSRWIWLQTLTSIATLCPSLETDPTLNVPLNYTEIGHLFISLNHLHFPQLLVVAPQIVFLNPSVSPIISSSYLSSCDTNIIHIRDHSTSFSNLQFTVVLSLYASASSKLFDNLSSFYSRYLPHCLPSSALTSRSLSA